jgi:hypothetical protein
MARQLILAIAESAGVWKQQLKTSRTAAERTVAKLWWLKRTNHDA